MKRKKQTPRKQQIKDGEQKEQQEEDEAYKDGPEDT